MNLARIPAFHRDANGQWREVTEAEYAATMLRIAEATCPSVLEAFPGDEVPSVCSKRAGHTSTSMCENEAGTRRWWTDRNGDVHAQAKPGSGPVRA